MADERRLVTGGSAALALGIGIALATGCGTLESRDAADEAVDRFHQLFNEANYSVIYLEADPDFRRSTTVPAFDALMRAVRRDLGTFRQARRTDFRLESGPDGPVATLVYESEFSEGRATEEFRVAIRDGTAHIVHYEIGSARLRIR